ncbi:hypothetical protein HP548_02490 [Paenibacillus taichungensis]|uniref:GIY-YIG nuclease family protein n=1 Tax=Paenibacillus taichungensis TaxID=484184 RepID=A0ABX2MIE5_9BACL|nr:hypothetical protein [Paenibacillus taichungensis]NUU52963.1 hypothetical protein [Paenibacillus taichungensis]
MGNYQFILEWYSAGQDYVAKSKDTVFRLHREYKTLKKYSKTLEYAFYKLQQRKSSNNEYRDMGYEFYLPVQFDYADLVSKYSIDGKYWDDANEMIDKTEEILLCNFFIEDDIEEQKSIVEVPTSIPPIASRMIVKQLKRKELIFDLDEYEIRSIEDMIMRAIQIYRSYDFSEIVNEDGHLDPIHLREFELHLKMCMSEPTMYFVGGWREIFNGQRHLHDDEWLSDSLEEESEEEDVLDTSSDYQEYQTTRVNNHKPKTRIPVSGYIYLVRISKYNLYGFRTTKGDSVRDTLFTQYGQMHQLEIVSHFKSDDVNRMFRFVKKQFEHKLVTVKEDGLSGLSWFNLDQDDILTITSLDFQEDIHIKLNQLDKEQDTCLKPGGYLMLFRDKNGSYLLRTTTKRNYQNLINRARVLDFAELTIGFLTKDIKRLLDYFDSNFKSYRDPSQHGLSKRYFFDELDITERLQILSLHEQLQIVEVVTA